MVLITGLTGNTKYISGGSCLKIKAIKMQNTKFKGVIKISNDKQHQLMLFYEVLYKIYLAKKKKEQVTSKTTGKTHS